MNVARDVFLIVTIGGLGGLIFVLMLELIGLGFIRIWNRIFAFLIKNYSSKDPQKLSPEITEPIEEFAINTVIGMLTLGMIYFAMGWGGILIPQLVLILPFILSIISFFSFRGVKSITNLITGLQNFDYKNSHTIWLYSGSFLLSLIVMFGAFRPPIEFDAVWYHLAIPKYFLQLGESAYLGNHLRYSVHPYLSFFTSLWPFSWGIGTVYSAIIINVFQGLLLVISTTYAVTAFHKHLSFPRWGLLVAPILIALNTETVAWIGGGYNDLYAYSIALIAITKISDLALVTRLNLAKNGYGDLLSYQDLGLILLILVALSLYKIFFILSAGIIAVYTLFVFWSRLPKIDRIFTKMFKIGIIGGSVALFFFLPWMVRAYIDTGRPLDPIGDPALTQDVYNFAGSKTPDNHWNIFVWDRLEGHIIPILFLVYSPIVLLSLFALTNQQIRQKFSDIWIVGWFGFITIYMISVVTQWRYMFAFVPLLALLGVIWLIKALETQSFFARAVSIFSLLTFLGFSPLIYEDTNLSKYYLLKPQTIENFMIKASLANQFMYYPSHEDIPDNLSKEEKIWVINVHSMGYIDNPILDDRQSPELFEGIDNSSQLFTMLKEQGVKYILAMFVSPEQYCKDIFGLSDPQKCNSLVESVTYNPAEGVSWYRIKD